MTQVLVNLPGGTTVKESAIQGISQVWLTANARGLFSPPAPPYHARAICAVYLIGGQTIQVTLAEEEYHDIADEDDAKKRVESVGKKKRDAVVKGIWP